MAATLVSALIGLILAPVVSLLSARPPLREGAESLTKPFRCDACRAPVRPGDAVPLLSWIRLRGLCRACRQPISRWDLAAEIGSVAVCALIGWRAGLHATLPAYLLFGEVMLVVVLVDLRLHKIATRFVYPAALGAIALLTLAAAHDSTWSSWKRSLLAALAVSAFIWFLVLVSPSGMGDGDARLGVLLGLFLGWQSWRHVYMGVLAGFLLGSIGGLVLIALRRGTRKTHIPFGPYLAAGAFLFVFWPGLVTRLGG